MNIKKDLILLMKKHKVNSIQVADILNVKPNTVRVWRSINGQKIPANKLELLKFKLEANDD